MPTLATDPGKDSLAGSSIVLDVNDKAAKVAVPCLSLIRCPCSMTCRWRR